VTATEERFSGLTDEAVMEELRAVFSKAKSNINLTDMPARGTGQVYMPVSGKKTALGCREFRGDIDKLWRISSFSSLISGRTHLIETADRDALVFPDSIDREEMEEPVGREDATDIYSFPKGAKAGTFFHDILEHLDFTEREPDVIKELASDKLNVYSFEDKWLDTVCEMITNVISTPLDPKQGGPILSSVNSADRLNELEFYFPLRTVNPERLSKMFQVESGFSLMKDFPETIGRLQFAPTKGFMRGFMDLVFLWQDRYYLVDWKSNYLGDRAEDYNQEAMASVMKREYYILQYTIYTLALDQYLRVRMPGYSYEKHFGGVYYIFLRGVNPDWGPEFGIYRDLPSPELVEGLREGLMERG
jgi:exodeoxyribonuclease V beta subunit